MFSHYLYNSFFFSFNFCYTILQPFLIILTAKEKLNFLQKINEQPVSEESEELLKNKTKNEIIISILNDKIKIYKDSEKMNSALINTLQSKVSVLNLSNNDLMLEKEQLKTEKDYRINIMKKETKENRNNRNRKSQISKSFLPFFAFDKNDYNP